MELVKAKRIPKEEKLLKITAKELDKLNKKYHSISISNADLIEVLNPALENCPDEYIGYLAGNIDVLIKEEQPTAIYDIWFVNNGYFNKNMILQD